MSSPNFQNRTLFQGDCLEIMQGMNSGCIDLIACDPPFNTQKDWTGQIKGSNRTAKFTDRWSWDENLHDEWMDTMEGINGPLHGYIQTLKISEPNMAAFLCWLGVRCLEMRRVLKPTGTFYLHLDHTAAAYAKVMLDCIFGRKNFRNEIIWHYVFGVSPKKDFRRKHDTILRYSKTDDYMPVDIRVQSRLVYNQTDEEGRKYLINGAGRIFYEGQGRMPDDVWTYVADKRFSQLASMSKERTGYPTQKPLYLYEQIIAASSNKGDVVLDCFAGCATTLVAAEKLERQWVGIDLWDGTKDILMQRMMDSRVLTAENRPVSHVIGAPVRTDGGDTAAPFLSEKLLQNKKTRFTKEQMKDILIDYWGCNCWGCGYVPEDNDRRYFDLDHIEPASAGGSNELPNRAVLCGPCNRDKGNTMTLLGLRAANKKAKRMKGNKPIELLIDLKEIKAWAERYMETTPQK